MRDQYAGDITDFLKFAFLRAIVPTGSVLGVAWYYLPDHDGRNDGRHVEYKHEPNWGKLDDNLHQELCRLKERSVEALQNLAIWNWKAVFHKEPVAIKSGRTAWAESMQRRLADCDVVFADPDNGISREGVVTLKSATLQEINDLSKERQRSVILIRFPSRVCGHLEQLAQHHESLASHHPLTVRTCVQVRNRVAKGFPRIRWFTLLNGSEAMKDLARDFVNQLKSIAGAKASFSEDSLW
jgi:hypothetical protein